MRCPSAALLLMGSICSISSQFFLSHKVQHHHRKEIRRIHHIPTNRNWHFPTILYTSVHTIWTSCNKDPSQNSMGGNRTQQPTNTCLNHCYMDAGTTRSDRPRPYGYRITTQRTVTSSTDTEYTCKYSPYTTSSPMMVT